MSTTRARAICLAATAALLLAACGGGDGPGAGGAPETDAAETATDAETEDAQDADDAETEDDAGETEGDVAVADSDFGEILVDGEGMSLYLFDQDEDGTSNCYDDCAATWPPLVVSGEPTAGEGADADLLDTTERDDGDVQVTYDGQPLYLYAPDEEPGDVTGQAVGEVWWLVEPSGAAIRDTEPAGGGGDDDTADY